VRQRKGKKRHPLSVRRLVDGDIMYAQKKAGKTKKSKKRQLVDGDIMYTQNVLYCARV
jgi:hypothetical protein